MNGITIYEHADFKGRSKAFTSDIADLKPVGWSQCVSSVKVTGQPWVAYENPNYSGKFLVFEEGEHSFVGEEMDDKISSLNLITENLTNPEITLYEHINYEGKMMVIKKATNLSKQEFDDRVSSHKVQSGAWLLSENEDGTGLNFIARQGVSFPNYLAINFNDKLSFLRPLRPGTQ
ncbi:epidermal differentiation-specific protein-like [Emydura macquarii macquarii]|uniref:epidermal differentiation-specific protein-like n=1 Tax=Emydura macquarii macquarii TaxID=1129001 RepID=UPI00352BA0CC